MWLLLFSVVVGAVMIAARAKELKDIKDSLKDILKDNKFEKYDYSKFIRIFYVLMILFGAGSAVYGFMIKDYDTAAIGIIIALAFVSEWLLIQYKFVLYYNDTQFVAGGKLCRYKSIKEFEEMKPLSFGFVRAKTFNDELLPLSKKAYEIVKEHKDHKKSK